MPPRRPPRGRHRRPKNTGAPVYVTAATLAAFTVSGVNVPGAIGDIRSNDPTAPSSKERAAKARAEALQEALEAQELRDRLAKQAANRASRLRELKAEARREARERQQRRAEARRKAAAAREAARPKWVLPVLNFEMSAGYGESSSLWSSTHTGQDFAAPEGTTVRSIGDGTIVFAGWDGSYGQKIVVQHLDGTFTWYAHLSSFLQTGGTVQAGEAIGRVGSTGNSTGPHLHIEVRMSETSPVPPLTWLRSKGVDI